MLEVSALGWTLTIAVIVALLALDLTLGVFRPHAVGFREATAWSVFYIAVAVAFGVVFASIVGWDYGTARGVIAQNAGCLDEVTEPRYVEWDLWDSNVMVRDGAIVTAAGVLASVLINYENVDITPFVCYFSLADIPG